MIFILKNFNFNKIYLERKKMSFDLRKELEKLNSTAPILKDRDEAYSDDGKLNLLYIWSKRF